MAKKEITIAPAAPRAKQATGRVAASKNFPVVTTGASRSSKSNTKTVAKKAVPAAPAAPRAKQATGRVAASKNLPVVTTGASKSSKLSDGYEFVTEVFSSTTQTLSDFRYRLLSGRAGGFFKGTLQVGGEVIDVAIKTGKQFTDNLSGAKIQEEIASLVENQRRYNDILATRLAEALDRIEKLEEQVARPTRGR